MTARKTMLDAVYDAAHELMRLNRRTVVAVSHEQMYDLLRELDRYYAFVGHQAAVTRQPWGLTFSGIDVVVVDLLHVAEPDGTVREVLWPAGWRRS